MHRISLLIPATVFCLVSSAQQMTLGWATPIPAQNQRVELASNGDLFAFGTADDAVHLQRISPAGSVLWTRILEAPQLWALDMDVDAQDNVYLYMGFSTGQLDLDLGPNQFLVDPGKVYAKYNSSGVFQWGFVLENLTDLSEDYGGISVDAEGNLYLCADLGAGTYDFDPTAGVYDLQVGTSTTGCAMARYNTDGSLDWAHIWTWAGGSGNARDIVVMQDGSTFDLICQLDNGGSLSTEIDVDLGPGVFNVPNDAQHILRYTSDLAFLGHIGTNYYQARITNDAAGKAYVLGYRLGGIGAVAAKYNLNGTTLEVVYETQLFTTGNLRLGDVRADAQGGCLGMYNNNCDFSKVRFYKMDVSGLVDFNLYLDSGTDCTMPGGKGFALDGNSFYLGTYNNNYEIDFDPDADVLSLPTGDNDGVIAKYDWCADAPFDPFEIVPLSPPCINSLTAFAVTAFGDASSYIWSVPAEWSILEGQGTDHVILSTTVVGTGTISVTAMNACGSSGPVNADFTFNDALPVDLGPDATICLGQMVTLDATTPGASYLWSPGNVFNATITDAPEQTTTYSVAVTNSNSCVAYDSITISVVPCLGVDENEQSNVILWPVPVRVGEVLRVEGIAAEDLLAITGSDGREWPITLTTREGPFALDMHGLPAGTFVLRTISGKALRFVIHE